VPVAGLEEQVRVGDGGDRAASTSPSPAKNSSASMPRICTVTPSGHGPIAQSPEAGWQARIDEHGALRAGHGRVVVRQP
jgi:hypothetical protein